ncbi:Polysaccharide deacetylase [Pigmentiphaga humi]|uniref:Polysaccharide deacetylase n=1 Tax=Pigmentiphaga humi TaxID=2478468 RepID=A0A3P4AZ87_9BURK|nr:polysaccharide deacetylase family protein [Pigmentiphaga humi]VCU69389.1 Polysaccharide deacetylase [Pigmentiphaga humi]
MSIDYGKLFAPHQPATHRPPDFAWPDGKRLAFWLAPNIEYYEVDPKPNATRAPWPRPFPDMQNWSWRDYGNRVGVWRCLELFDKHGMSGSVSLNSAMCQHLPQVVQPFVDRGWELFCHGQYNTRYVFGETPDQEREHLQAACNEIAAFSGAKVRGLLSPALTYNVSTLEGAVACGLDYVFDLGAADSVLPLAVGDSRLLSIPYSSELNDFFAVVVGGLSAHAYVERFKAQFDQLLKDSEVQPKVVGLPLHPYLIGMPQYIWALDQILLHVKSCRDMVWITQARAIADYYDQKLDASGAHALSAPGVST